MQVQKIPEVAVLTSAFFVVSLVHVPVGPTSVHLLMNGLLGVLLGWPAFPAIFVAMVLQALLFQFGGFTTLGVNTLVMAAPAIVVYYLFGTAIKRGNHHLAFATGFAAGACSVVLGGLITALCLYLTGEAFYTAAKAMLIAHLPLMIIEGIVTSFCVSFLRKVKPEILAIPMVESE
ncbi:cobalt transporter CbiM [Candidatus Magnetobacterium bavaricum]|uniref:Cobalt transporter CbiM n=1 Tax=Candidatus Magnetobacterium bavaricum TaxID=29290 RepID=A0A0F3GYS7_9BACT|nr:cobalt transporter CbiM [Candidatus Magnetobacterium bavaricum]